MLDFVRFEFDEFRQHLLCTETRDRHLTRVDTDGAMLARVIDLDNAPGQSVVRIHARFPVGRVEAASD